MFLSRGRTSRLRRSSQNSGRQGSRRPHLAVDGHDLQDLPLVERKRRLRTIMPTIESRLLYADHIQKRGTDFFRAGRDR